MQRLERRRLLHAGATALLVGLPGCSDDGADEDPADRGPLAIDEFAFAASEPDAYGEYEEQPDDTFAPGDDVWLYVSLDGLSAEPTDGGVQTQLDVRIQIETPEDGTWFDETDSVEQELGAEHLERFYWYTSFGVPENARAGDYEVTLSFTDRVSETSAEAGGTLTIAE